MGPCPRWEEDDMILFGEAVVIGYAMPNGATEGGGQRRVEFRTPANQFFS